MKSKNLLYMLPALIMAGCSKSASMHFDSGQLENAPQANVSSVVIKEGLEDYVYPIKIAKCDSLFLMQDLMNKGFVYVLDSKGETVDCLVKKGNGHTEISNLSENFSIDKARGVVSLYSAPFYVEYNVAEFMKKGTDYCRKTNCSSFVRNSIKNVRKFADGYLAEGFTEEMRFIVVDKNTQTAYTDYPPMLPEDKKEDIARVLTYASNVLVSPNSPRWVQTSYIGAVFEIFEYDGREIKCVGTNPIYEPVYTGGKGDVSWNEETTIGFDDVVVTDGYIYTLLNGAKGSQLKSDPPVNPFTNKITVFDWDGNVRQIINTDCMLKAIDVDEKENVCYAISFDLDHGYDLRKIPLPILKETDDK